MKKILMTGGTGLVGSALVEYYLNTDSEMYILTRSDRTSKEPFVHYINWSEDGWEAYLPPQIDIVINLAGASLNNRWTRAHKEAMMKSRIETTKRLYNYFEKQNDAPKVLFNASAVGYYPPSKVVSYDEYDQFLSHDFLSTIVERWEQTAWLFDQLGTRVVIGRFGVILSRDGGALPTMIKPYQFFVGGPLGSGKQWMSWIHIDDLIKGITTLIQHEQIKGVYNLCSPHPVRQNELGQSIGKAMHRPHLLPVPKFVLQLLLGEQSAVILDVQKVFPKKLQEENFEFDYPYIDDAVRHLLK